MSDELAGIFPARLTAAAVARSRGDLEDLARATLFVPWPTPPRVGSQVRIDLAIGDQGPQRLAARVVATRAGGGPVAAGFKALLLSPPASVLAKLRGLMEQVRPPPPPVVETPTRSALAQPVAPRLPLARMALEPPAARSLPTTPVPQSKAVAAPQPVAAAQEPFAIDLPDDDGPLELWDQGALAEMSSEFRQSPAAGPALEIAGLDLEPAALPQTPVPRSKTEPTASPLPRAQVTPLLVEAPTHPPAPPSFPRAPRAPPSARASVAARPAPEAPRARVNIASAQSFRVHYRRFLARGEAYCVEQPAPPPGTQVELRVDIPDGEPPLRATALVEREVGPPEVPLPGFVVTLVDPDGAHRQRLSRAALALGG